jgi:hypothetical protein
MTSDEREESDKIITNSDNYTDLYHLTLTKLLRRLGDNYGIEGYFTLTRNGEALLENVKGQITNIPPHHQKNPYSDDSSRLNLYFEQSGSDYILSSTLYFKALTEADKEMRSEEYTRILERLRTDVSNSILAGEFETVVLNGSELNLDRANYNICERNMPQSGEIEYNSAEKLIDGSIVIGDKNQSGYFAEIDMDLSSYQDYTVEENKVTGWFYVYYNESASDVFYGTLTGLDGKAGDLLTLKSDDGKYFIQVKIADIAKINSRAGKGSIAKTSYFKEVR